MNKTFLQRVSLLSIAGLLGLGQLQKLDGVPIFLHEVVMICFVIFSSSEIVKRLRDTNKNTILQPSFMFIIYLFAVTLIQLIWSPISIVAIGLMYGARLLVYGLFALSVYSMLKQKSLQYNELGLLVVITTCIVAVAGLLQFFFLPDLRILRFSGWDDHYLRLTSTLLDPSFTGILLFLGGVTLLHRLLSKYSHKLLLLFSITVLAVLFTYSRGTYLACVSWLIVLSLYLPKIRRLFLWMILVGAVIIASLPRPASEGARLERITSIQARIVNITSTLQSMKVKDWVIGKGWYIAFADREVNNTLTTVSHSSSPDNSFLHVLQSLGLVGFGLFMWLLRKIWMHISIQGKAIFVAVSIASLFSQILFYPFVMILLPYTLLLNRKT